MSVPTTTTSTMNRQEKTTEKGIEIVEQQKRRVARLFRSVVFISYNYKCLLKSISRIEQWLTKYISFGLLLYHRYILIKFSFHNMPIAPSIFLSCFADCIVCFFVSVIFFCASKNFCHKTEWSKQLFCAAALTSKWIYFVSAQHQSFCAVEMF